MGIVYSINKGINRPIEFKGLRAQWIWYLGIGIVLLLLLFAVLYLSGVSIFFCLLLIAALGSFLTYTVYRMSKVYGEHGLMKRLARGRIPQAVKCTSRKLFIQFNKNKSEDGKVVA